MAARRRLVITAFHVVSDPHHLLADVDGRVVDAQLVAAAPCDDLALLRIGGLMPLHTLPLARGTASPTGTRSEMLGFPTSTLPSPPLREVPARIERAQGGFPSYTHRLPDFPDTLFLDRKPRRGMSGGPVLDGAGAVVGMVVAWLGTALEAKPTGLAVSARRLRALLPALARGRDMLWPGFGLTVAGGDNPALLSANAQPGSPARRAGFGTGRPRRIVSIMGRLVDDIPSYCAAARSAARRASVLVGYDAGGAKVRFARLPFP